ncbi:xanthine dehydrogenase subunit D [Mesobacillus maritimus]|uniref:Xanthine dehydrogenase subunit D n=1 Tax=Mesobacillus maritimus TaxID=1643336 RepID=A0ABS7K0H5_9BACI|nr:xanthine dehydrogenase subunit D [Mesobacillus maritimus]MBY0095752.1 xanthine dehydrogenase subunit D [Mesobacillus maritimus]
MGNYTSSILKTSRIRPDGIEKVTGKLSYLTDLQIQGMLYGKVLRSQYPHAKILNISVEKAEQLPGVKAVITSKDVPGLNGFGLIFPDQPVFCDSVVRYVGDAIAAVAAITPEIAEKALHLIEVDYEPLPVIDDPEKALDPSSIPLHPNGNLLHQASYVNGNVHESFPHCDVVVEETYQLPRQMHAYMETEGGLFIPEEDGLSVYAGTQHGYKDRFQLSRILDLPETEIRVVSSPMGGSFGGKDELNIQPYGALLALKTGCPVKIHQSRRESVCAGIKKHPMKITVKTGATKEGKLLAHQVRILADTGAYATLGPAVLDFAVEHAVGPYVIPNVETHGFCLFTNNGVAGEFRGFGGNQITFALEGQIDRLADQLGICPLEMRKRNLRKPTDCGPVGQEIAPTNGDELVLKEIAHSPLLKTEKAHKQDSWKKVGTGVALTMHGGGLGFGRLDPAGGKIALNQDGKIQIMFGFEEVGQGLLAVIETLTTKAIGCSTADLEIVIGDTDKAPHSGSSTASRGTSMVWHSLERLKGPFIEKLVTQASAISDYPKEQLVLGENGVWLCENSEEKLVVTYKQLAEEKTVSVETQFDFPTTPNAIPGGHFLYSFAAVAVKVEVNLVTGHVKVIDIDQAVAAGPVVNPIGYLGQIEGGTIMALGYTLLEEAQMEEGRYVTNNFDSYLIPGIQDIPASMHVRAIEDLWEGDSYGPRGVGEIGTIALAPAIARAIYEATGHWVTKLPVSRDEILQSRERI